MFKFKTTPILVLDDGLEVELPTEYSTMAQLREDLILAVFGARQKTERSQSMAASVAAWNLGYEGHSSIFKVLSRFRGKRRA